MKKYLKAHSCLSTALMAGLVATSLLTMPLSSDAQDTSEKVRLMAETLRARDTGDMGLAKEKAEELIRLSPNNTNAQRVLASINEELDAPVAAAADAEVAVDVLLDEAKELEASGDLDGAQASLDAYSAAGGNARTAERLASSLERKASDPAFVNIADISPKFAADAEVVEDLLLRGRAQFINGDYDGASSSFREVEARAPNNAEAKFYSKRIAEVVGSIQKANLYKTREQMMTEVEQQWERPKVFDVSASESFGDSGDSSTQRKLNSIVIPQVNFSGMELTRAIETLSELSLQYDPAGEGVNIVVLFNPNNTNPRVNISLRNLSLDRILQFVTQQVNFTYEVGSDAVTVAPSFGPEGGQSTVTEFFPISAGTVIRLTGFGDSSAAASAPDPFAPSAPTGGNAPSANEKTEALQAFFQRAGVNFELPGASIAFDGEQLIVTQTRQNLDRMRAILRNYSEVKQVEIEAKFLEVAQNDLEELGFDWTVTQDGATVADLSMRSIGSAFGVSSNESSIVIKESATASTSFDSGGNSQTTVIPGSEDSYPIVPPTIPSTIDFALDRTVSTFAKSALGQIDSYNVDLAIRALSRKTGTDLMSAPKVTVLSGKRATIQVGQEFRYPESYGDIESTASSSGGAVGGGSGAAISITAGTPEDFTTRNVGVELAVTPNVENDDTISLVLEPKVTEFEGFVEYGGPSIAIAGGTTVSVPAGFFQPIFSVREISTEVTVFDGATLVMGGLTRDEVKTVKDKVPVLGDIPGVGRLFRSEGETRQKRNLLVFVTANLVSPGGSLSRQNYDNAKANALFQNPTVMTPSGAANRTIDN
jgi:general secretion pathway protein D